MPENFQSLHLLQLAGSLLDPLIEGGLTRIGTMTQVPRLERDQLAYIYYPSCRDFAFGSDQFETSCHHWWESLRQTKQDHLAECIFRLTKPAKASREKKELEKAIDLVLEDVSRDLGLDCDLPPRSLVYEWPAQVEGLFYCQKIMRLFASRMKDQQATFSLTMMELLACSAIDGDKRGLKWNVLCAGLNVSIDNASNNSKLFFVADVAESLINRCANERSRERVVKKLAEFDVRLNSDVLNLEQHKFNELLSVELDRLTIGQLKEIALGLNAELQRGKPRKAELIERIVECLVSGVSVFANDAMRSTGQWSEGRV